MFPSWKFLKFGEAFNLFVRYLVPVNKKMHKTKFEIEAKDTNLQRPKKLPL